MYLRSSQMETMGRGRHGGGAELSGSLWMRPVPAPLCVHRPGSPPNPIILDIWWRLDWSNHCPFIINSTFSPSPLYSLEMTLMLGKIEGRKRTGRQRMRWLNGITNSIDMSLSKLWEIVKDWRTGKPGVLQSTGWQRVRHDLVTEQWTTSCSGNKYVLALTNSTQVLCSFDVRIAK